VAEPGSAAPATVVVLAGDRAEPSALLTAAGVPAKALVPLAGEPLALRVLRCVDSFAPAARRALVGPAPAVLAEPGPLADYLDAHRWQRLAPDESPARSLAAALDALTAAPQQTFPLLVTTADHALLTPALLRSFIDSAATARAEGPMDLAVAFTAYDGVMAAFPDGRRTGLKLADGRFCSCNLFLLYEPAALGVIAFWRRVEALRKQPVRMLRLIRPSLLLRYLTGRLTLASALRAVGDRAGARVGAVLLDEPRAAVDVDSIDDWRLVQRLIAGR